MPLNAQPTALRQSAESLEDRRLPLQLSLGSVAEAASGLEGPCPVVDDFSSGALEHRDPEEGPESRESPARREHDDAGACENRCALLASHRHHTELGASKLDSADQTKPELTIRADNALKRRLEKLETKVRQRARQSARDQDLSHTDKPHVVAAWREASMRGTVIEKRVSWFCGVSSGCLFSFIVALFSRDELPPLEQSVALLLLFSITLAVGWSKTN